MKQRSCYHLPCVGDRYAACDRIHEFDGVENDFVRHNRNLKEKLIVKGRAIISITEIIIYLRQVEVLQRVELLHDLLPQLLPLGLVNHPDADVEGGVHRLVITDLTENIMFRQWNKRLCMIL